MPESDGRSVGALLTPSIAFRHLHPNPARLGKGSLFFFFFFFRTAVHRRCQHPPKGFGTDKTVEANNIAAKRAYRHGAHPPRVQKEFRLDSNDFGFICAVVSNVGN